MSPARELYGALQRLVKAVELADRGGVDNDFHFGALADARAAIAGAVELMPELLAVTAAAEPENEGSVVALMPPGRMRFDPRPPWAALSPDLQRQVGAAAMLLAYVRLGAFHSEETTGVGFEAAEDVALGVISAALPAIAVREGAPFPLPDLSIFGVRACRLCGCTDAVGCPEGCAWVSEDLCSVCDARAGGVQPW